jgi:hypothetical protein
MKPKASTSGGQRHRHLVEHARKRPHAPVLGAEHRIRERQADRRAGGAGERDHGKARTEGTTEARVRRDVAIPLRGEPSRQDRVEPQLAERSREQQRDRHREVGEVGDRHPAQEHGFTLRACALLPRVDAFA